MLALVATALMFDCHPYIPQALTVLTALKRQCHGSRHKLEEFITGMATAACCCCWCSSWLPVLFGACGCPKVGCSVPGCLSQAVWALWKRRSRTLCYRTCTTHIH